MYHVTDEGGAVWATGPEFQLEDNEKAADPVRCGWLYALYQPPIDPKTGKTLDATKPVGEWNHVRLLITPAKCEHDINGVKYFEYVLDSDDFNERVAKSKFAKMPELRQSRQRLRCPARRPRPRRVPEHQNPPPGRTRKVALLKPFEKEPRPRFVSLSFPKLGAPVKRTSARVKVPPVQLDGSAPQTMPTASPRGGVGSRHGGALTGESCTAKNVPDLRRCAARMDSQQAGNRKGSARLGESPHGCQAVWGGWRCLLVS